MFLPKVVHSGEPACAEVSHRDRQMFRAGVLSENDVALLQEAIARTTRMAAEQNIDIDPHYAAARLCEFYWAVSVMRRKWLRPCSVGFACISQALRIGRLSGRA